MDKGYSRIATDHHRPPSSQYKLFFVLLSLTLRDHPLASDRTAQGFFQFPNPWTTHTLLIRACLICRSHISHCSIFIMLSTGFPVLTTRKPSNGFLEKLAATSAN